MQDYKPICIIPARGGSKRIPHKNIKSFCGKPIIAYAIKNALKSKLDYNVNPKSKSSLKSSPLFSQVIVSTEDKKIAKIAKKYGASVPFMRPKHLADDTTATLPVIANVLDSLEALGTPINDNTPICVLYPTTPLIDSSHIEKSFEVFNRDSKNSKCEYVFFASQCEKKILRGFVLESPNIDNITSSGHCNATDCNDIIGTPKMLFKHYEGICTQDLPSVYLDAGTLYWGRASAFLTQKPIFSSHSLALVLDSNHAQDIDTPNDWNLAKAKFLKNLKKQTTKQNEKN